MKVINQRTGAMVSDSVEMADTFTKRLLGLIPRKNLGPGEGMLLDPCDMIHMCFMSFPIDAVFLDKDWKTVKIFPNMKPWSFSPMVGQARRVLELPAGHCEGRVTEGDILSIV